MAAVTEKAVDPGGNGSVVCSVAFPSNVPMPNPARIQALILLTIPFPDDSTLWLNSLANCLSLSSLTCWKHSQPHADVVCADGGRRLLVSVSRTAVPSLA